LQLRAKNRPGIGLFIHAVKSGQKPSLTKPDCGWKEWADEADKRHLMEYLHSHEGDIMVHFIGGRARCNGRSNMSDSTQALKERIAQLEAELRAELRAMRRHSLA